MLPLLAAAALMLPVQAMAAGQGTFDGPYAKAADNLVVDDNITGTAFFAGNAVTINGNIEGDLFVAGERVDINGVVNGNVYAAANLVHIAGRVNGDCFSAGNTVFVEPNALLARDAFLAGANVSVNGPIGRHLYSGGQKMTLNSTIGQDANLQTNDMVVTGNAKIGGNLTYKSDHRMGIPAGAVAGATVFHLQKPDQVKHQDNIGDILWHMLLAVLAALLVWFILSLVCKDFWDNTSGRISARPYATMGVGALVLLVAPLLVIILLITIIGIPLALLLALAYAAALYLSKVVVAAFLGGLLAKRFPAMAKHHGVWSVLIGLIVVQAVLEIPIVGFFGGLLMLLFGLGALLMMFWPTRQGKPVSPADYPVQQNHPEVLQ